MTMKNEVTVLLAEDDEGHAGLIKRNLARAGLSNPILHFKDGQEIIDFLFSPEIRLKQISGNAFVLLLDIRMPKISGIEVLQLVKHDSELKKIPVIMITTTDDPREVEKCHKAGCNCYITKPVEYDAFVNAVRQLGFFLSIVEIPRVFLNNSDS